MTHTSTEQPEALRLADALRDGQYSLYQERAATEAELRRLHARAQELEAERDEADRRAGRAERHMAGLNDDVRRFEAARRRMKAQWGVHDNVSFDVVWQQALDAKASQAQRVPLSLSNAATLAASIKTRCCYALPPYASHVIHVAIRETERAHGITQEKQG
jgi:hypothetical protein